MQFSSCANLPALIVGLWSDLESKEGGWERWEGDNLDDTKSLAVSLRQSGIWSDTNGCFDTGVTPAWWRGQQITAGFLPISVIEKISVIYFVFVSR